MRASVVFTLAGLLVVATGCTSASTDPAEQRAESVTSAPDAALTLVADADPVASAVSASRALFDRSTVAVVARDGDDAGELLGASTAVGLGVPLLVESAGGGVGDVLGAELDRLGATTVLAVGEADPAPASATWSADQGREVVAVPAEVAAVEAATGLDLSDAGPVPADGGPVAVAALNPENPAALRPVDVGGPGSSSTAEDGSEDGTTVPAVDRGDPLTGTLVLASGSPE